MKSYWNLILNQILKNLKLPVFQLMALYFDKNFLHFLNNNLHYPDK